MKVHALEKSGNRTRCVVHYTTPAGSNSAGVTWVAALAATVPTSVLTEGTGPGQITSAELALVTAGSVVEFSHSFDIDGSGGSAAQIGPEVAAAITAHKAALADRLKWYGRAEGTVN